MILFHTESTNRSDCYYDMQPLGYKHSRRPPITNYSIC